MFLYNDTLEHLIAKQPLSYEQAYVLFAKIMQGELSSEQIAGILVALRAKAEEVEEVVAAATAMRHVAQLIVAPSDAIDVCGTGGDQLGTINLSTAAALVVAAAGVPVAKHGNRSVSSRSGSADVLEKLGIPIDLSPELAQKALKTQKFAFLFAPLYHPAMKYAAPVRKALAIRTVFNLLGPLTNPAQVKRQLMGVYSAHWLEPLAQVFGRLGHVRAMVVHSHDGLDEVSLAAPTSITEWVNGHIERTTLEPHHFGCKYLALDTVKGGDAAENGKIIYQAFMQPQSPVAQWIMVNAAAALRVAKDLSWAAATDLAYETMKTHQPLQLLEKLQKKDDHRHS